jgi:hypothetical protein
MHVGGEKQVGEVLGASLDLAFLPTELHRP